MGLLDIIILILLVSWLGGFSAHIGGEAVHILLVVAIIVLIGRLLSGRKLA